MKMKIPASMMASMMAIVVSTTVYAQNSDVVVMRRVISKPTKPPFQGGLIPDRDPAVAGRFHWEKSDWYTPDAACSATAPETRLVGCVKDFKQQADEMCVDAGAKPETERVVSGNFDSCSFEWIKTGEQSCANSDRPSAYTCRRSDGTPMGDASCIGVPGRPASCTFAWKPTGTVPSTNHCVAHQDLARIVSCVASDGSIMPDSRCTGAKPAGGTADVPDLSGCTFKWTPGEYGAWDNQCSATATRTRTVSCRRSDGGLAQSSESCEGERPSATETGANYAGCGHSWKPGAWSAPDSTCSNTATHTRVSTCVRDIDQVEVSDLSLCTGEKPPESEKLVSVAGCTFDWVRSDYGDWSSTCSERAVRNRTIQCRRSDGALSDVQGDAFYSVTAGVVTSGKCVKDAPGLLSETQEVTSGCTYDWKPSAWSLDGAQCSATGTRSRTVACARSDGKTVDDAMCKAETKPPVSESVENYSGCTFGWADSFSPWDSTCSDTAHRTNTAYCRRSNGSVEPDQSKCTAEKPKAVETLPVYTGCISDWAVSEYGPYTTACTPTKTRSRTVQCVTKFPSGDAVAPNAGVCSKSRPAENDTPVDNSTMVCGYEWATSNQSAPSSTCSDSASYTQTVTCMSKLAGGTKAPVADSFCGAGRPSENVVGPITTSCSYKWDADNFGPWSSTCSKSAYRYQTPTCRRSDGTVEKDTKLCGNPTPSPSQGPVQNVTDCGGVLQNPGFETTATSSFPGWTSVGTPIVSTFKHGGTYAYDFNRGSGTKQLYQDVPTQIGVDYTISYWCWSFLSAGTTIMSWNGTQVASCHSNDRNGAWLQSSATVKATSATSRLTFTMAGDNTLSGQYAVRMDDVIMSPIVQ